MQKEFIINKEKFYVNDNEFLEDIIEQYSTLKLYPHIGVLEREIGLIRDIAVIFKYHEPTFLNIGLSHGGFLPLKLIDYFNKMYVVTTDSYHINNLKQNMELYDQYHKIKITDGTDLNTDNQFNIIKINDKNVNGQISLNNHTILLAYSLFNIENFKHYKLSNSDLIVYIPNEFSDTFEFHFRYYFEGDELNYNNLIHLCIMVKNAGNGFREVLEKNLPFIDEWTILDTGSTDNTIEIIKDVMKNKKGKLYQEPFINFRDSRNRCLELAGKTCKYIIMLDDTYILKGNVKYFLELIRSDQFADSYNIFINSNDCIYGSNRILKSDRDLKYIYKIHEIIRDTDNIVVQIPMDKMYIEDLQSEYMQIRTKSRKENDLQLLFETLEEYPNVSRTYFYIAETYCALEIWDKAFEYAMKRINAPVKGYTEEITESYLICGNIAEQEFKWEWSRCEELYLKCYESDKTKADPLFCIGAHYYYANNYIKAYEYLKHAFELGISKTSTSNLRYELYDKMLPYLLTIVCYKVNDYELGIKAVEKYLQKYKDDIIKAYYNIFKLLDINERTSKNNNIVCFVADGGFKKWSGSSINNEGIGGSETYIIELSRNIAKLSNSKVYVFCKTNKEEEFEGVKYRDISNYIKFIKNHKINTCIISRYSEYIFPTLKNDVDNIYLVVHDLIPSGNIIPYDPKFKGILCMTEWHKEYFINLFPSFEDITTVFPNGINIDQYPTNIVKKKNTFIYSSFANRGLINLLKMFPKIRAKIPDAELHVFCDTKNNWVRSVANDEMDQIEKLLELQSEYVINHGWVSKTILTKYFLESEYWLYPCTFMETFCITALEAAASNTLAITNDLAALKNTVDGRGIVIPGDANTEEWQENAINEILNIIDEKEIKDKLLQENRLWAEKHDWKNITLEFIKKYIIGI
jgi:hypothetical protein